MCYVTVSVLTDIEVQLCVCVCVQLWEAEKLNTVGRSQQRERMLGGIILCLDELGYADKDCDL